MHAETDCDVHLHYNRPCRELFRKGLIADAMASVKRGYDEMG
jgi:hypothetical protein